MFADGPGVFEPESLYNLDKDPSENIDESKNQPETIVRLTAQAKEFYGGLERVKLCPPLAAK